MRGNRHVEIGELVGEVAATYLARDYHPGEVDTISALVRGIRDPELCRELVEAELEVGPIVADGPRQGVISELNRRKALLEENPHLRRPLGELERRDEPRDVPDREYVYLDENGEPYDRSDTVSAKIAAMRTGGDEAELAADGGEE